MFGEIEEKSVEKIKIKDWLLFLLIAAGVIFVIVGLVGGLPGGVPVE